ncbi:hypothetical protein SXCC_01418 [Gluconacetobacter sp. SXCC-1]|nr:hypothetical protein SXCC_01418 [Gluconacetobacter sp. SXCC-1]
MCFTQLVPLDSHSILHALTRYSVKRPFHKKKILNIDRS